jgi:DNA invertase Pin-like site-specific DNA recombinase
MTSTGKKRAAIYLRISRDPNNDGLAIDRQRDDCLKILREKAWTLAGDAYIDDSKSAFDRKTTRPRYNQMVKDFEAGKFDAIVCWDLDRLTRQPAQLESWIEAAETQGVVIVTANGEADLSTDNGRLFARIKAAVARGEQERKSVRIKRAFEQHRGLGRRSGGRRPFGYELDVFEKHGEQKVWVAPGPVVEVEAEAIREGYQELLSGKPLARIARQWNDRGLSTGQTRRVEGSRGEPSPFTAFSVRQVLLNPRYAGIVTHRGVEITTRTDDEGNVVELKPAWQPIVAEETFRAAEAVLKDPARFTGKGSGKYLLSGVALCGVEGCDGHAHAGGASRPGVRGYRCSATGGHFSRKAEPPEQYVEAIVIARLSRPDARDLLVKQGEDTKGLRHEVLVIDRRIESLAGLVGDGTFTTAQARAATEKLKVQRAALTARIADSGRVDVLGGLVGEADVAAKWDRLDIDRRRAVIDALMTVSLLPVGHGTRTFRPETVNIEWKTT